MAEEMQMQEAGKGLKKRKIGHKKGKGGKRMKAFQGSGQKVKMDAKTKKFFRKRARDYNSDGSDDADDREEDEPVSVEKFEKQQLPKENEGDDEAHADDREEKEPKENEGDDEKSSDDETEDDNVDGGEEDEVSEDEGGEIQPGVMKFSEGSKSFKAAFKKIIKRSGTDDVLGPVLSAHKKLVAEKLAEEEVERKVKGEAKKEKHLLAEKGHVKPDTFSVSHEKFLIGLATKGVVKLFNAVNKAQKSQKGLNPLRSKDAKVIQKRKKAAFFSELGKPISGSTAKASTSTGVGDGEGPAWAPLRDNYMLTNSKLKDWDKAADAPGARDDFGRPHDSSSDDDED